MDADTHVLLYALATHVMNHNDRQMAAMAGPTAAAATMIIPEPTSA
jgi:hypothetical protein